LKLKTDEVATEEGAADENEGEDSSKPAEPMVAVVNVHLEGHPMPFPIWPRGSNTREGTENNPLPRNTKLASSMR